MRGFAPVFILVGILILAAVGYGAFVYNRSNAIPPNQNSPAAQSTSSKSIPIAQQNLPTTTEQPQQRSTTSNPAQTTTLSNNVPLPSKPYDGTFSDAKYGFSIDSGFNIVH